MVRGLALGQIGASNVGALVWKEVRGGADQRRLAPGAVLGIVVLLWFRGPALAAVIAIALTCNPVSPRLGGVFVPVTLKRMGFDPALAGGVILTTITDVMGFLTFLGLATLVLLRLIRARCANAGNRSRSHAMQAQPRFFAPLSAAFASLLLSACA